MAIKITEKLCTINYSVILKNSANCLLNTTTPHVLKKKHSNTPMYPHKKKKKNYNTIWFNFFCHHFVNFVSSNISTQLSNTKKINLSNNIRQ